MSTAESFDEPGPGIEPAPRITVQLADALEALRALPDASTDTVICDPPYGLGDHTPAQIVTALTAWVNGDRDHVPDGRGFMGRAWDAFVPPPAVWDECLRVLRPGGHLAAFAGARTVDLMGLSIRLAGFEVRDTIGVAGWTYSSGFPKSLNVGKAITATERYGGANSVRIRKARLGDSATATGRAGNRDGMGGSPGNRLGDDPTRYVDTEHTEAARRWDGWGTALSPAIEPIILARKPLSGTVAATVLEHGTGAINIGATRTAGVDAEAGRTRHGGGSAVSGSMAGPLNPDVRPASPAGRWPKNFLITHHPSCGPDPEPGVEPGPCVPDCHVRTLDEQTGITKSTAHSRGNGIGDGYHGSRAEWLGVRGTSDEGGGSRFFPTFRYQAKAPKRERPQAWGADPACRCTGPTARPIDPDTGALPAWWRAGTECAGCGRPAVLRGHSTVKPQGLIEWLVKLLVRPGGTLVDPFTGSGAIGQAARTVGVSAHLIDNDPHSVRLTQTRLGLPFTPLLSPLRSPSPEPAPDFGTVSLTLITPRDAGTTTHLEDAMDTTDEAPDRAAPQDPDRPWSGREETDRVTHGFPPWRTLDDGIDERAAAGLDEPDTESAEQAERAAEPQPEPDPGRPPHERDAERPDWFGVLALYADGKKTSVTVVRPAVRKALDALEDAWDASDVLVAGTVADDDELTRLRAEVARLRGEVARSRLPGVEHPAPEPEPEPDNRTVIDTAPSSRTIDPVLRERLADELRTRFPDGPRDGWSAGWLSAAGYIASDSAIGEGSDTDIRPPGAIEERAQLAQAKSEAYDRGWNVGRAVGAEDAEMSRTAYDRGWSDAIADAIGNRIWAGAPLAWRHVQPGDVVLTDPDEDSPAGVPWIVDANDEARGTFARKVTLRGAGTRADAELDPDTTATVLLPAAERAAIVALRTGAGARIGDRS